MRRYGLRVQKDQVQCMGSAWVMGHDRIVIPEARASHLVFGTALCDMICGRPAVGRPFFGEAKLSTDAIRATSDGSRQAGRQVHSSRGSITSMANLSTANGDDESRQRG